jgi:hypothetical protein
VSPVSIAEQTFAPAAAELSSAAALAGGKMKFRRTAKPDSDIPPAPPTSHSPQRPDGTILSEAIPLFAIGRNKAGLWVARDCDSSVGGEFWSKSAAVRFAKSINGPDCALMFVSDGLELAQVSPPAGRRLDPARSQIAKAIAAIGQWIKLVLLAVAKANKSSEQKVLIEKELYSNQYRHRSKSDDDLPIVR